MPKAKVLPKVSVLERRLLNPFGSPSIKIDLKDGGQWATRWVSETLRTGRVYQVQGLGWDFVTPDDIVGDPADFGCQVLDQRLVRGDASQREVLMKMPQADFDAITRAKRDKNLSGLGSTKKIKEEAANAAAKEFGTDEAADTIYRSNLSVNDSRVNMDLDGDAPT